MTNKKNSTVISRTSYEGAQYTHQGALLDTEWQEFLLMDDEYDEWEKSGLAADGFPGMSIVPPLSLLSNFLY